MCNKFGIQASFEQLIHMDVTRYVNGATMIATSSILQNKIFLISKKNQRRRSLELVISAKTFRQHNNHTHGEVQASLNTKIFC